MKLSHSAAGGGKISRTTGTMISGLVLAGGAGRRVQGSDKGLLPWHGEPLVVHVVNRLTPQVDQLLVSCNRNRDRYGEIATLTQSDLRADYQGPLAGLEAAAADILHPLLLVVPCDSPALPLDLAERLAAPLQADAQIDITWARCPQRNHYLHALLHFDEAPPCYNTRE